MAAPAVRTTTWADEKDTYEAGLMSLFGGRPEETEADLRKMFTPDFTLRDATPDRVELMTLEDFIKHMRWLRENVPSVTLTVTQWVRTGNQLAERHEGTTTLADGSSRLSETFQFAELAEDGRIRWIVESVVPRRTSKDPSEDKSEKSQEKSKENPEEKPEQ